MQEATTEFPHPDVGWTPSGQSTERAHSALSPFTAPPTTTFLLLLPPPPSPPSSSPPPAPPCFPPLFCLDNRGPGETIQRGKAKGLCGSSINGGWSEVLRGGASRKETLKFSEVSDGGFFSPCGRSDEEGRTENQVGEEVCLRLT